MPVLQYLQSLRAWPTSSSRGVDGHQNHVAAAVCFHALQGFQRRFLRNIATKESFRPLTAADCPVSGCPPSPLANHHLAPLCAYVQACDSGTQALVSSEVSCMLLKMALHLSCLLHSREWGWICHL